MVSSKEMPCDHTATAHDEELGRQSTCISPEEDMAIFQTSL